MSQTLQASVDTSLPPAVAEGATTFARPDAHTQRYDRQLRLWASSGQRSLESSRILCIGSSALAGQILKNLILPGIGSFVVVDDARVAKSDLGINFFLEENSEGASRAQETTRCLVELNPGVKGEALVIPPGYLLTTAREILNSSTLVLLVNQPAELVDAIADAVWEGPNSATAVLSVRAAGLIGEIALNSVIETHPDKTDDLRLTRPFGALQEFAFSYPIDKSDTHAYAHIPFIVLILRALASWKAENGGAMPQSKDRKAFAALLDKERSKEAEGENFDEAHAALGTHLWRAISAGAVPEEIQQLFKDEACDTINAQTPKSATPRGGEGQLPLPGSLPDLKAVSSTYVKLATVYRSEAAADLAALKEHLALTLVKVGVAQDSIDEEEVARFAKLAGHVRLVRGRKLSEARKSVDGDVLSGALADPVNPVVVHHALAFLASDAFYTQNNRLPGSSALFSSQLIGGGAKFASSSATSSAASTTTISSDEARSTPTYDGNPRAAKRQRSGEPDEATTLMSAEDPDVQQDEAQLLGFVERVCEKAGVVDEDDVERVKNSARELLRSGHADLPSTTALLGGVAAQEAIKLITRQYIPMNNTCIYDGIQQAIGTFAL